MSSNIYNRKKRNKVVTPVQSDAIRFSSTAITFMRLRLTVMLLGPVQLQPTNAFKCMIPVREKEGSHHLSITATPL